MVPLGLPSARPMAQALRLPFEYYIYIYIICICGSDRSILFQVTNYELNSLNYRNHLLCIIMKSTKVQTLAEFDPKYFD